jgi:signal transduction histidine kinase
MKRPALVWTVFFAALAVALGVMLFFTVKMLDFERSMAQAQAHAALEETVRLALWRMDSTAAVILSQSRSKTFTLNNNTNPNVPNQDLAERYQSQSQIAMSSNEAKIRQTLDPVHTGDWHKIAPVLLDRVSDILPGASLEAAPPTPDPADTRLLATIPARLIVPDSALPDASLPWNTPARVSLIIAWACAALAVIAIAQLLAATLSLSARRGAFASAVTHELRTPLTTFRMYAEMLATGMVSGEAQRREYLTTLVAESDRLGHLIENVLAYSKLENRIAPQRLLESQTVQQLIDHAFPLLRRRAEQAGLALSVNITDPAAICKTDPVAVGQILINLVDNACKYARSPIALTAATVGDHLEIHIRDQGPGIPVKQAARLFRPFSKSKTDPIPGIGLGLFVSRQLARALGGSLEYHAGNPGAEFVLPVPARHS